MIDQNDLENLDFSVKQHLALIFKNISFLLITLSLGAENFRTDTPIFFSKMFKVILRFSNDLENSDFLVKKDLALIFV